MLMLNTEMWKSDHVVKLHSSSNWEKSDSKIMTECVLKQVKSHLEEAIKTASEMILIVDLSKGDFPPWMQAISIAKFFMSMKNLIKEGMAFTIIYANTDNQKKWIKRILSVYKPVKPINMVNAKKEIISKIIEHKQLL